MHKFDLHLAYGATLGHFHSVRGTAYRWRNRCVGTKNLILSVQRRCKSPMMHSDGCEGLPGVDREGVLAGRCILHGRQTVVQRVAREVLVLFNTNVLCGTRKFRSGLNRVISLARRLLRKLLALKSDTVLVVLNLGLFGHTGKLVLSFELLNV